MTLKSEFFLVYLDFISINTYLCRRFHNKRFEYQLFLVFSGPYKTMFREEITASGAGSDSIN